MYTSLFRTRSTFKCLFVFATLALVLSSTLGLMECGCESDTLKKEIRIWVDPKAQEESKLSKEEGWAG